MAVSENLKIANAMNEKVKQIKDYAVNFKKVKNLRAEIEKGNKQIKEDKESWRLHIGRRKKSLRSLVV